MGLGQHVERIGRGARPHLFGDLLARDAEPAPGVRRTEAIVQADVAVGPRQVAHGVQRLVDGVLRHEHPTRPRFQQEVGRIGADEAVRLAVARAPQAEGSVGALTVEDFGHRLLQRGLGGRGLRLADQRLADEQPWRRRRRHLFGAAVGIDIERGGQRAGVDIAERRIADLHRHRSRLIAVQQVGGRGPDLADLLRGDIDARDRPPAVARLDVEAVVEMIALTVEIELDRRDAGGLRRVDRDALDGAVAVIEVEGFLEGDDEAVEALDHRLIKPRLAVDIVQLQRRRRMVARREEARQRQVGHHRLAHDHPPLRRADAAVGPGHGHDAQFAGELVDGQAQGRLAVAAQIQHARPQGHGADRRRGQALAADLVGAELQRRGRAEIRIEQPPVIVVVIDAQRALAEIPFDRIGRGEFRQIQDALIDHGDADARAFAEAHALHLNRHLDIIVAVGVAPGRLRLVAERQLDVELARPRIERDIDQADGAARLGRGDRIARLHQADQHIGAAAPVRRGLEPHGRSVIADRDGFQVDDVIAGHRDLRFALIGAFQSQLKRVALLVGLGAEAQAHEVRRVAVALIRAAPARREAVHRLGQTRRLDLDAVVAPVEAALERQAGIGVEVHHLVGDQHVVMRAPPVPAPVLDIPVIVVDFRDQPHMHALDGGFLPLRRQADNVEAHLRRVAPVLRLLLIDLDAEIEGRGQDLQRLALLDRTPARLEHRGGQKHAERLGRRAGLGCGEGEDRPALPVRGRRGQVDIFFGVRLGIVAEGIVLIGGEGRRIGADARLAGDLQAGADGAVEIVGADCHRACLVETGDRLGRVRVDVDAEALRREVLDREGRRSRRIVHAVEQHLGGPLPARRRFRQGDVLAREALRRGGEGVAEGLDAGRAIDDQSALAVLDHAALRIAHQGDQMHGFARTVDAPVGVNVRIDAEGAGPAVCIFGAALALLPAADGVRGQVHRRAGDVGGGVVVVRPVGHDHLGRQGVRPFQQRAREGGVAVGVGGRRAQRLAVRRDQIDADSRHRFGGFQRAHHHVEAVRPLIGHHRHVGVEDPAPRLGGLVVRLLVAPAACVARLDDIGARLQRLQHRAERKDRGDALTVLHLHRQLAGPDLDADVVGGIVAIAVIVFALGDRIGRRHRLAHQIAVGDAPDLDGQRRDIDRLDGHAVAVRARQHHAVARKADIGRLGSDAEIEIGVGGQRVAVLRGQPFQQGDAAVGKAEAGHAQCVVLDRNGGRRRQGGRDDDIVAVRLGRIERA